MVAGGRGSSRGGGEGELGGWMHLKLELAGFVDGLEGCGE